MPPKRTRPSTPTTRSRTQQSTLSFHGSKAQNRITKPSATRNDTKLKKDPALFDITPGNASPDLAAPTTAEVAIAKQVQVEQVKAQREVEAQRDPLVGGDGVRVEEVLGGKAAESEVGATGGRGSGWVGDEEARARGISEAQIKKYWRGKEQERKAPRVHQEGLSLAEKVLREWDMSGQYGPCIGIARLKRWKRANVLGLQPPIEVLAVMLREMDKGEVKAQRAYVDELMSSRFIET
ncbi:hypothetical protein M8818_004017 [Zalaria obscura]|uniref:Uncharacterized protein n=1 Tax=Zalaria obscura TaxID=2024903 RepID=A0ACC3SD81_9PEZI